MIGNWADVLKAGWADVSLRPVGTRRFRSRRLPMESALDAHVGLRAVDNAPCLLVEAAILPDTAFELGGMRLAAAAGDVGPLLVLSLEDLAAIDLFTAVCADVLEATARDTSDQPLSAFLARLAAWRRFLRERRSGLSRNETVGLMGELIVLDRLLAMDPQLLPSWTAPDGSLHDFHNIGHALEVKTTLGVGARIHIFNLDQLDSTGLRRLNLLHIRLAEAPDGKSLAAIVAGVENRIVDSALRDFKNALLRRGLMPDDSAALTGPTIQVQGINAYSISSSCPRLVRASVPHGIVDAEYTVDLAALAVHSTDVDSVIAHFGGDDNGH